MKKKPKAYEHKASAKDYLVALAYFPNYVKLLNPTDKPYEKLINWLIEKEAFLKDDDLRLPTIKEVSQQLGIDASKISKYLKMIYEDIHDLNFDEPHLFKKEGQVLCTVLFKYLGAYGSFRLGLDIIPRIGERFYFYFIKAKLGGSGYNVTEIYHDVDYNGHSVTISLSASTPNT